jgi:hypothetical protein
MPTIRDLIEGWTPPETPTLREVATTPVEHAVYEDNPGWSARMPGDESHPVGEAVTNPLPELGGPLALSRALRAGEIPFDQERQVRAYLDQFQKQTGHVLYEPKHHRANDPEPRIPGVYGDDTSLPLSISATRRRPVVDPDDDFNVEDIEF